MNDLISRQAAIDALMKRDKELRNINWYDKPFAESECKGIDCALEIINALPSVQPQPVVRCKDCKHWKHDHTCSEHALVSPMCANDFCSRAERRKDG